MDIQPIKVRRLDLPDVKTEFLPPPIVSTLSSPVTVDIGLPIIDMPGCVEARDVTNETTTSIFGDDPNGVVTLCGAGVPSFDPLNYEPNRMILTGPPELPPVEPPEPVVPETPEIPPPPPPPPVQCPTPAQEAKEPIGTLVNGFRERVVGYRLLGNECVQDTEPVPIQVQIIEGLPSGGQVVQVGSIAVVATTSALLAKPLADLLLKVVKPTVKKVIKKIAKIRGKKVTVESSRDRRAQQRIRNHAIRKLKGKE